MNRKLLPSILFLLLVCAFPAVFAQKENPRKYPSVFWEITGNGLKKPSYLFGTMHVSSKLAFHLSDSFYNALQNVDAVALELNTDTWQGNMVNLNQLKENYNRYIQPSGNDYLNENSFRINKYDDELKIALSTQPAVLNNLLYRSYKTKEDFEEDTFLDLYIYQTGKKLGKRSTGVEDYFETERLILEAYADMSSEKTKKNIDTDGESMRDINEKIQDAYKRGDLDLMDSLSILTERSTAFNEKFLYRRNEIQAESMDTIMKKSSLFVGVGAAHLPGKRGVIELLRKMGYTLRPIKMTNREASKKEAIDKLKVPVTFSTITAEDGFYKADMPGVLYKVAEDYTRSDRQQYADMANGCYYQVTRVKTYAAFINQTEDQVKRKLDSLLYENIPGKIIKKTAIIKNGYTGYDITNKTRRGDLQRYQIFITPFEILIFKMSGKENYIEGKEANLFFSSIALKEADSAAKVFTPEQGGFTVHFPQTPSAYNNTNLSDGINRWEYEAIDKATGNVYCIFKKSVYNFKFLDEDSFDLRLIEESFRSPDYFEYQLQRKLSSFNGYPCLEVKEKMKDSSVITAKYIISGPHYFALAVRSKSNDADAFFNSFRIAPYQYNQGRLYADTFLHFTVNTPVEPLLDNKYRTTAEKAVLDIAEANSSENTYWTKSRNAVFNNDTTGEMIVVSVQKYPPYYYVKDSSKFWQNEINDSYDETDLVLKDKTWFEKSKDVKGYRFTLTDTGSSRVIQKMLLLKDNYLFNISCMGDTLNHQSSFINNFLSSFTAEQKLLGRNIFQNTLDSFFSNLFSSDSTTRIKTRQMISNIYYGEKGLPKIINTINRLSPADKDYVATKAKLIAELGYIKDTTHPVVVEHLNQLYKNVGDTSIFQNEILEALARHKTSAATAAFKELVLQDPPVFENDYAYSSLFEHFDDSLSLATILFPDFLQLTSLEDYKEPVNDLLVQLVDSGLMKGSQYQEYFNKIYFDARIELKKQMGKDEKTIQADRMKTDDNAGDVRYGDDDNKETLSEYAVLLAPFYQLNNTVAKFFDKLLLSRNDDVRLAAVSILLKNNHPVPDSILLNMASDDQVRGKLYSELVNIKKEAVFPIKYKTQLDLARSYLAQQKNYTKMDSVVFIAKQPATYKNEKGIVYFFKYRVKKEDDWKMGISGLQPIKLSALSSKHDLTSMTDKKLKEDKPANDQFEEQLKRLLFTAHKSAKNFYNNEQFNYRYFNED